MNFEDVLERAASRGVDLSGLVIGRLPNQVPQAPSHRWVVFPASDGGTVIGGMDRGRFVPYAEYTDPEGAADALAHLTATPPAPPAPRPLQVLASAALAVSDRMHEAFRQQPVLPGTVIGPGTPLDHLGSESGHCLYLLNTPMSQRSLPPTDLTQQRTGYVAIGALPAEASVERVPPWFGQPGGGVMVRLPRVISYYVDVGLLLRFDPSLEVHSSRRADRPEADRPPPRRSVGEGSVSVGADRSGTFVSYAGRTLEVVFRARHALGVSDDGGPFPDALDRGSNAEVGAWVRLPKASIDRMWDHYVGATWEGESVQVVRVIGDEAVIAHGWNPEWARAHGLQGSQYEGGFSGRAPAAELTDVFTEDTERTLT